MIGGNFNARTGTEGVAVEVEEKKRSGEKKDKTSKDKKINSEGKKLMELIEERGCSIQW